MDTFLPKEKALQSISDTVSNIKNKQRGSMLLPGEKEARKRKKALREGIPFSPKQVERLERLGKKIGLGKLEPCEMKATD